MFFWAAAGLRGVTLVKSLSSGTKEAEIDTHCLYLSTRTVLIPGWRHL